jgi:hypothetical protein
MTGGGTMTGGLEIQLVCAGLVGAMPWVLSHA